MTHIMEDNRHPMEGTEDSVGIRERFKRKIQMNGPREGRKEIIKKGEKKPT